MDIDETNRWPGLTSTEAAELLKKHGYNELPSQKQSGILQVLIKVVSEPMLILLLAIMVIYIFLGDAKDAMLLSSFVLLVVGITFYQERKTEKTLEKLKNLSSPKALVIRNGQRKKIPGREIVVGDVFLLQEGDRIPADAVVLSCVNLSIDESILTGESLAVRKTPWDGNKNKQRPGGDDLPFVYSGSLVVSGRGVAQVMETGTNTEIGKIGKSLQTIKMEDTLLHKETKRIVRIFSIWALIFCVLVFGIYIYNHESVIKAILAGLTLGMAILPEEFPVVLIIFLTLGAWRISKRNVLTRNPSAIETLGAATTLCVDKTGTITLNKMNLAYLHIPYRSHELSEEELAKTPEVFHNLLEYSNLACPKEPYDPLEKEIKRVSHEAIEPKWKSHHEWKLLKEYPLTRELLSLCHVWESPNEQHYIVAAKGAPETIADLCKLKKQDKLNLMEQVLKMSSEGLRIIGVAKSKWNKGDFPDKQQNFDFEFVGLLGFRDPIRASVPASLAEAYRAGIRVIMITGDFPGTAVYIAKKIGLKNPENFITGEELEKFDGSELKERIKTVNIFARVVPEQKLIIVNALKANHEIVAMTGDGVNDAPALKSANIGIAMGERGTDVAREASSLVLLNDDFSSIVAAVKLGRRIYDNLKNAMSYTFAVHIPIVGMSILPLLFNVPLVLFPAHIAFLEMIIDPACSTVFEAEPEEKDIMRKPPRDIKEKLFGKSSVLMALIQGISTLTITFGVFYIMTQVGVPESKSRSITFLLLVLSNLALITSDLSSTKTALQTLFSKNKALWVVIIGAVSALGLVIYVPAIASIFHFSPLSALEITYTLVGLLVIAMWFEIVETAYRGSNLFK